MRILLLGLNFFPELVGIGRYTGEMAQFLAGQGHDVRVVTTPPYYPQWQVQQGYRWWRYQREAWQGMQIVRCPLWVPRKPSGLKRLVHLFSYALTSFPALLGQLLWRPAVVMCIAPTFFSAPFAWLTARMSGAKCWLHIQDFELDAAANLEILPSAHFLLKLAAHWEAWMLSRFDRVSTISQRMLERLEQKGVPSERIVLFPNWVDTQAIFPLSEGKDSLRNELMISEDKIVVLYSGSMGAKQGLENLVYTAQKLQEQANILFVFCGEGPGRDELIKATQNLSNVKHISLQPLEKLNALLNTADIHILPQKAKVSDLVMPSKLPGILASGRAVIAIAFPDTEIGRVISRVGLLVSPQAASGLADAILSLGASPQLRRRFGEQGRTYVCENWSAEIVLPRFMEQLSKLMEGIS
ncbi:MAG: WcaI family glycosyltransferase [Anaerolineales bacterium]